MKDFDKYISDKESPVVVSREERMFIRDGKMENAVKAFRRPAYPNLKRKERE